LSVHAHVFAMLTSAGNDRITHISHAEEDIIVMDVFPAVKQSRPGNKRSDDQAVKSSDVYSAVMRIVVDSCERCHCPVSKRSAKKGPRSWRPADVLTAIDRRTLTRLDLRGIKSSKSYLGKKATSTRYYRVTPSLSPTRLPQTRSHRKVHWTVV